MPDRVLGLRGPCDPYTWSAERRRPLRTPLNPLDKDPLVRPDVEDGAKVRVFILIVARWRIDKGRASWHNKKHKTDYCTNYFIQS